jgi:hypothetical protein
MNVLDFYSHDAVMLWDHLRSAVEAQSIITIIMAVITMIIMQLGGTEEDWQLGASKLYP